MKYDLLWRGRKYAQHISHSVYLSSHITFCVLVFTYHILCTCLHISHSVYLPSHITAHITAHITFCVLVFQYHILCTCLHCVGAGAGHTICVYVCILRTYHCIGAVAVVIVGRVCLCMYACMHPVYLSLRWLRRCCDCRAHYVCVYV